MLLIMLMRPVDKGQASERRGNKMTERFENGWTEKVEELEKRVKGLENYEKAWVGFRKQYKTSWLTGDGTHGNLSWLMDKFMMEVNNVD